MTDNEELRKRVQELESIKEEFDTIKKDVSKVDKEMVKLDTAVVKLMDETVQVHAAITEEKENGIDAENEDGNEKADEAVSWSEVIKKKVLKNKIEEKDIKNLVKDEVLKAQKNNNDETSRKNNIIIYRMPESDSEDNKERIAFDNDFVNDLAQNGLKLQKEQIPINKIYRLGKKNAEVARPLLVKFESPEAKDHVMNNLNKLKSADPKYRAISIAHDLTPSQRESLRRAITDAKEKMLANQSNGNINGNSGNSKFRVVGPPHNLRVIAVRHHQDAQ